MKKILPLIKRNLLVLAVLFLLPNISSGQTVAQDTLGNTLVNGNLRIDSTMIVTDSIHARSDVNVYGDINLRGALNFSSTFGVNYTKSTNSTSPNILNFGKAGAPVPPLSPCITGFSSGATKSQFPSILQVYTEATGGGYLSGGSVLSLGAWGTGASIDMSGAGTGGALLLNYFCGKDVAICNGANGGMVTMGDKVVSNKNFQIGANWQVIDPNVSLNIYQNATNDGIKLWPSSNSARMINTDQGQFVVYGNGSSHFKSNVQIGFANSTIQDINTALNINAPGTGGNAPGIGGIKINTSSTNPAAKMFSIDYNNSTVPPFIIYGNGCTHIESSFEVGFNNGYIQDINTAINVNMATFHTTGVKINATPSNQPQPAFIIHNSGNSAPPYAIWTDGNAHFGTNMQIGFTSQFIQNLGVALNINNQAKDGIKFNTWNNGAKIISINNSNFSTSPFTVNGDGKTQIGGEFLSNSVYMLTVNGKIGAREIKVSMQNPWPDFVFEKSYNLQSLESIENYVSENKHLPGIPSAKELQKEECGLDLAQMQGLQMQKIEDIFLYLIDIKKELEALKKENQELKKQISK